MPYSNAVQVILIGLWAAGSLVLAWRVSHRSYAYFGSVAMAVPAIAYAMLGYGLLEMGGILHALAAGLYVLPFHFLFHRRREPIN